MNRRQQRACWCSVGAGSECAVSAEWRVRSALVCASGESVVHGVRYVKRVRCSSRGMTNGGRSIARSF